MKTEYLFIAALIGLALLVTVGNADESTRFVTTSEEMLPSGYSIVAVEDTDTGNLIYLTRYESNPDFEMQVVPTEESSVTMW